MEEERRRAIEQPPPPPMPLAASQELKRRRLTRKVSSAMCVAPPATASSSSHSKTDVGQKIDNDEQEASLHHIQNQHFRLRVMENSIHPSEVLHKAVLKVKAEIRSHPTVPADPQNSKVPMPDVFDDSVAVQLPHKHCAFVGCLWPHNNRTTQKTLSTKDLLDHIMTDDQHKQVLEAAVNLLPSCYPFPVRYMSIYNEAIAEKIRGGAPLASYSIDRRALANLDHALQQNICAPMCFLCGCIYMYRERPEYNLYQEQENLKIILLGIVFACIQSISAVSREHKPKDSMD